MGRREGEVKDLVEKLERGELTKDEVLAEMKKRGLFHHANEPIPGIFALTGVFVWGVLCFLPFACKILNLGIPEIPSVQISIELAYLAILLAVVMVPPLFYSFNLRERRSVTGDENIVLVKSGAYGIVRHPAFLAGLLMFVTLPIIINGLTLILPFTLLSILGEIAIVICFHLQAWHEEKVNIKKWGDEYRLYMREVPRFNFIVGIWRCAKRKKHGQNKNECIQARAKW